jgi:hypothetical protein
LQIGEYEVNALNTLEDGHGASSVFNSDDAVAFAFKYKRYEFAYFFLILSDQDCALLPYHWLPLLDQRAETLPVDPFSRGSGGGDGTTQLRSDK